LAIMLNALRSEKNSPPKKTLSSLFLEFGLGFQYCVFCWIAHSTSIYTLTFGTGRESQCFIFHRTWHKFEPDRIISPYAIRFWSWVGELAQSICLGMEELSKGIQSSLSLDA
jgi:hypothetical protein